MPTNGKIGVDLSCGTQVFSEAISQASSCLPDVDLVAGTTF